MEFESLIISGSLFVVCVALFYLWLRAEGKFRNLKRNVVDY